VPEAGLTAPRPAAAPAPHPDGPGLLRRFRTSAHWLGGLAVAAGLGNALFTLYLTEERPGWARRETLFVILFLVSAALHLTLGVGACLKHLWAVYGLLGLKAVGLLACALALVLGQTQFVAAAVAEAVLLTLAEATLRRARAARAAGLPLAPVNLRPGDGLLWRYRAALRWSAGYFIALGAVGPFLLMLSCALVLGSLGSAHAGGERVAGMLLFPAGLGVAVFTGVGGAAALARRAWPLYGLAALSGLCAAAGLVLAFLASPYALIGTAAWAGGLAWSVRALVLDGRLRRHGIPPGAVPAVLRDDPGAGRLRAARPAGMSPLRILGGVAACLGGVALIAGTLLPWASWDNRSAMTWHRDGLGGESRGPAVDSSWMIGGGLNTPSLHVNGFGGDGVLLIDRGRRHDTLASPRDAPGGWVLLLALALFAAAFLPARWLLPALGLTAAACGAGVFLRLLRFTATAAAWDDLLRLDARLGPGAYLVLGAGCLAGAGGLLACLPGTQRTSRAGVFPHG
jgi:hypothetical protein